MKRIAQWLAIIVCGLLAGCVTVSESRPDFAQLIARPLVPLAPEAGEVANTNGLTQIAFSFASEAGQRVPGVLFKRPDRTGLRPAVIALHGTGGTKADMFALCRKLATNGFVAVAIDGRHHGERTAAGKGTDEYFAAITRAWDSGDEHPFFYDTVWDIQRLLDYLESRPDVDARRIGAIGISKGGIEAYLAAATDRRIAVVVPCIAIQSFHWALENNAWQGRIKTIQPAFDAIAKKAGVTNVTAAFVQDFYDRLVPGIYREFDGPAVLTLIAPRPMLAISSDTDPNTPLPGVLLAADAARAAYKKQQAEDRFELRMQTNTAHRVRPESERAAIEWFAKWLGP